MSRMETSVEEDLKASLREQKKYVTSLRGSRKR